MILLPKYAGSEMEVDIRPARPMAGLAGEFRCELADLNGRVVYATDWDSNLILDSGLDLIGQYTPFSNCSIGESAVPPDESQTELFDRKQTGGGGVILGTWGTAPFYELTSTLRYTFGNNVPLTVREMALHRYNHPEQCYNRHLVTPEIVKGVDNILYIYYKHYLYPMLGDMVLNDHDIGGELFDITVRAIDVDRTWGYNGSASYMHFNQLGTGSSFTRHFDGDIQDILGGPSGAGTTSYNTSSTLDAYTDGNRYRDQHFYCGITRANVPGGFLRSSQYPYTGCPAQIGYDATTGPNIGKGVPKNGTNEFRWSMRMSWDRYTP